MLASPGRYVCFSEIDLMASEFECKKTKNPNPERWCKASATKLVPPGNYLLFDPFPQPYELQESRFVQGSLLNCLTTPLSHFPCNVSPLEYQRWRSAFGHSEIQAGTELLQQRRHNTYKMSEGDSARVRPCGDVAVCSRLCATKWRHSSDLTAIPEISSSCCVSPALVHSLAHSFLPSSSFFHRQPVNLHHVFLNRGGGSS